MDKISKGTSDHNSLNVCLHGDLKETLLKKILPVENMSADSDVKYTDIVKSGLNEGESSAQDSPPSDHSSKGICMTENDHGHIVHQRQIMMSQDLKRCEETVGNISTFGDKRMNESEPHSKKRKLSTCFHGETSSCSGRKVAVQSEDDYDHIIGGLVYAVTSFPGSSIPHDIYHECIQGCQCKELCSENCSCFEQYGCPYENGKLKEQHYKKPVFECNDLCNCTHDCPNRVVQGGPVMGLKIVPFHDKGYGVVSSYFIPKNSFVCEYAGEYIGIEEARVRFSKQADKDSNYILVMKEHVLERASEPQITVIDPTVVGNIGRYINHSCNPNLVVVPVRINSILPVAALFATRHILPGEELCYDYSNIVMPKEGGFNKSSDSKPDAHLCKSNNGNHKGKFCELHGKSHNIAGCELLNVSSSDSSLDRAEKLDGDSLLHLRKPCCCKADNCRKFLPADKAIF